MDQNLNHDILAVKNLLKMNPQLTKVEQDLILYSKGKYSGGSLHLTNFTDLKIIIGSYTANNPASVELNTIYYFLIETLYKVLSKDEHRHFLLQLGEDLPKKKRIDLDYLCVMALSRLTLLQVRTDDGSVLWDIGEIDLDLMESILVFRNLNKLQL
jgi:hypothetical protein